MQQVKACMMVSMEYTIRTTGRDGDIAELPKQSCQFVYGVHAQYPSVETAIMNKQTGDRVHVYVPPEELFGQHDESLVRELPREDYKQNRLQPGKMYREMKQKTLIQFMVNDLRENVIVADFNDPRCGTSAEFDILITDVREASEADMKPSCALPPH